MAFIEPITLTGKLTTLEPLAFDQHDALVAAVSDGQLWNLWYTSIPNADNMRPEIERRLDLLKQGTMLPFLIRRTDTAAACGMTTFIHAEAEHRRLEIGATWMALSAQRTGINTEAKLLLLTHAFESLHCIAVEFRAHIMNHQSRAAIERLGAKQDGILRNHQIGKDGIIRDTVVFSIIESEWPAVKQHLQRKLER